MKSQLFVIFAFLAMLSTFGALAAVGNYDYCGKPCDEPSGFVCAYNQRCFTYFLNRCEMKQKNCDTGDRFMEERISSCMVGRKCRI